MKKTSAKPKPSSSKSSLTERRYTLKEGVMHRRVEGQILILTPNEEFLYTLNDSGQVLWNLLVRGTTEQKLVHALMRQYALSRPQAQKDVQTFLRALRARGILASK